MPKPTLTIGGTISAAEAKHLATMLAQEWAPPIAAEEGDDHPIEFDENGDPEALAERYLTQIENSAEAGEPFIIGSWDYQSPREMRALMKWLEAQRERLTWRIYMPSHPDTDGTFYDGSVVVEGKDAPSFLGLAGFVSLNADDHPVIVVPPIEDDDDEDALIAAARAANAVFGCHPPPLVIEA